MNFRVTMSKNSFLQLTRHFLKSINHTLNEDRGVIKVPKYSSGSQKKVEIVMHEFKRGKTVKSRKQAITK